MPTEYDHGRGTPLDVPEVEPTRVHRDGDFYDSPPAITGPDEDEDLDSMTKAELVELAEQRGVDSSGTKSELVAALRGD